MDIQQKASEMFEMIIQFLNKCKAEERELFSEIEFSDSKDKDFLINIIDYEGNSHELKEYVHLSLFDKMTIKKAEKMFFDIEDKLLKMDKQEDGYLKLTLNLDTNNVNCQMKYRAS